MRCKDFNLFLEKAHPYRRLGGVTCVALPQEYKIRKYQKQVKQVHVW